MKNDLFVEKFSVYNPYTEKLESRVPICSVKNLKEIIKNSYKQSCNLSTSQKIELFNKLSEKIFSDKQKIADLMSSETGLCLQNTLHEVDRAINCIKAGVFELEKKSNRYTSKDFDFEHSSSKHLEIFYAPCDLIAAITPYNHPLNMVIHKVVPAIISGTPIIIKPSERAPSAAFYLCEILVNLGLNKNFFNVVCSSNPQELVEELATSNFIDVVCFTGSVRVGKLIGKLIAGSDRLKKYIPELGGNSPVYIHSDADISTAVKVCLGGFENSGQRCTAVRRIILHEEIYDNFINAFVSSVEKIKFGDPMKESTEMGTVISEQHAFNIQKRINEAVKLGGRILYGNKRDGALLSPTVMDNVPLEAELVKEENFGPVITISKVCNVDDAIEITNADKFGLAASIITKSKIYAEHYFKNIDVGQFSWNGRPGFRFESAPFGGFKDSGNGQKEGIVMLTESFSKIKTFYKHTI